MMGRPPARIFRDVSDPSVLVKCRDCPWWFAIRLDIIEAYKAGERHEITVHDVEPARAEAARILYEKRQHAVSV